MARMIKYASFKGIRFEVERHEEKFARSIVKHPIALEIEAQYEDNGIEDEGFEVSGFVAGPDASFTVDLLRKKLRESKVGQLVHPYYGMLSVVCKAYSINESFRQSGKVNLKFTFIEVKESSKDLIKKVSDKIGEAEKWLDDNVYGPFTEALEIVRMPSFVVASAVQMLTNINNFISSVNGLGVIGSELETIGGLSNNLEDEALNLLKTPDIMARSIVAGIRSFPRLETAFSFFDRIERPPLGGEKSTELVELRNKRAFSDLAAYAAIIKLKEEMEARPSGDYSASLENAKLLIDTLTSDPSSDKLFLSSYELKSLIDFGHVKSKIKIESSKPSLVIAYEYYESLDGEALFLGQNQIKDPMNVKAGSYVR